MEVERFGPREFEELITNRGRMYGFLARVYGAEVNQELLDQMVKMDLSIGVDEPEIGVGYQMLKGFLEHLAGGTLTDLAVEYARIFLGAGLGGGNGAYLYESVYTNPHRLVMQEARDQVLQIYREEGLDKAEEFVEPEDHITLELEFMAHLCEKTSEAFEVGDKSAALSYLNKQKDFLEKHLLVWAPTFCANVELIAQTDFYKAMAKVTTGYLKMEQGLIGELIDEINGTS